MKQIHDAHGLRVEACIIPTTRHKGPGGDVIELVGVVIHRIGHHPWRFRKREDRSHFNSFGTHPKLYPEANQGAQRKVDAKGYN